MTDRKEDQQYAPASSHRLMIRSDVLAWLRDQADVEGDTLSYVVNRALLATMRECADLSEL